MNKIELKALIAVFVLGLLHFLFEESINPSSYLNVDQELWFLRSDNYIYAILNLDFLKGIQTIHPGITVMFLSGILILLGDIILNIPIFHDYYTNEMYIKLFNMPIILSMILFFFIIYYALVKAQFNKYISLFTIMFFSLNVYYIIGSSPTDKYATMSIICSLVYIIIYVNQKYEARKYLLLASFFSAFGILSKLTALILIPFILFILFFYFPLNKKKLIGCMRSFRDYILYVALFMLIIFPGFIYAPISSVSRIIGRGNNSLIAGVNTEMSVLYAPSLFEKVSSYLFFWTSSILSPIALISFVIFIAFYLKKIIFRGLSTDYSEENIFYKNVFVLFLFGIVYFFFVVIFGNSIFYRYLIPIAMLINIGSAIGLYKIILLFKKYCNPNGKIKNIALKLIIFIYLFESYHLLLIYHFSIPITR